jgi:hypothetical protein
MKNILLLVLTAAVAFAAGTLITSRKLHAFKMEQAQREAAWLAEKSQFEAELATARQRQSAPAPAPAPVTPIPPNAALRTNASSPANPAPGYDLMARLATVSVQASSNKAPNYRQIIAQLENLTALGPAAVPAIRDFLRQNQDTVFAQTGPPPGKGPKWKQEAAMPASLRAGLLDTLKRIGGPEAEQLLVETLASTGRGYEVLTIARALEEVAPGKYRGTILSTTQSLLANPPAGEFATRLDQHSRDYLFQVLGQYGDANTLAQIGGYLVGPDGTVDEAVVGLLEKGAAETTLPIVYQALQDSRITEAKQREPLLELAMNHVGADPQAGELFLAVMQSADTSVRLREKALRHLAGEGLENEDAPTARDQQVLQSRLQYLDAVRPALADPVLVSAWEKTRARIAGQLTPSPKKP